MIVRWSGRVAAGATSDQTWAFWDFLPTAAELAGVQPPDGIDGISIVPTLLGTGEQKQHAFFYWEFHEGKTSKQAVRMGPWKAVRAAPSAPLQLYDLRCELGEERDVAADHPHVVAKIAGYLKTARSPSEHWPLRE
jgi:arylsulfatase A-like enzyme